MMMMTHKHTFNVVDNTDSVTVVAAGDDIGRVHYDGDVGNVSNDDGNVGNVVNVAVVISR